MSWLRFLFLWGIAVAVIVASPGCESKKKSSGTTVDEQLALAKERAKKRKAAQEKKDAEDAASGNLPRERGENRGDRSKKAREAVERQLRNQSREAVDAEYERHQKESRERKARGKRKSERRDRLQTATPRQKMDIYAEDRPKKEIVKPAANVARKFTRDSSYKNKLELNSERRKFFAIGIEHFRENSRLSDRSKRQAIKLCEQVFKNHFPSAHQLPNQWEDLHRQARVLIQGDCNLEPMVLLVGAIAANGAGEHNDSFQWIYESIDQFHNSVYPDRMYAFARGYSMQIVDNHEMAISDVESIAQGASTIFHWLDKDLRAEPDEYRFVFEVMDMYFDYVAYKRYSVAEQQKIMIDAGIAPPWIKEMLEVEFYTGQAWSARGHGYANSVSSKGWEVFRDYNQRASKIARKAYELNPSFPNAAAELVSLAYLGFDDESPEYWMAKVQEAQFDFPRIFGSYLNFSLPQWGRAA